MVLEIELSGKMRCFLVSKEGFECFMPQNQDEKDIINTIVKAVCVKEEPTLYKEDENLYKKTIYKKNDEGVIEDVEVIEAPELIETCAFVGHKGAFSALKEVVSFTTSLFLLGEALEENQDFKSQCRMEAIKRATGITKGMYALRMACDIGKSLDDISKRMARNKGALRFQEGKVLLGVTVCSDYSFLSKIDPLLFKAYRFMFMPKSENHKPSLQGALLEQEKLREEIACLSEQTQSKVLDLMNGPKHKCTFAIPLIVSILNRQFLEAQAYVRLSKLHDTSLLISEYQFLKSRFRSMGLILADQFIRFSLILGMEGVIDSFAFCEGGIMFVSSLARSVVQQPLKDSAASILGTFSKLVK